MINLAAYFLGSALTLAASGNLLANDNKLPDTIALIKPGVVAVGTYMPTRNPRALFLATGFAVGNGDRIVTNAHVLEKKLDGARLERFAVFYLQDQKEHMLIANIAGVDGEHDLAMLTLEGGKLPPLEIGDSRKVKEGEQFAFTGYPIGMVLGLYPVTHHTMVSAISPNAIPAIATNQLNVNMLRKLQTPYNVFQLDATAYPGNSGSPLYDPDSGKVVGIINKVFVQGSKENAITNPSGITYAIPAEYIRALAGQTSLQ
ncbi:MULTISPECIES: serine protease [Methylomonas]|uniref:Peptidase S1 n=1 Tax=Methylomonas koyamae TaxID=702114 RepID=A0A177PFM7_9GAMM|nr:MULTISPECIES: serine protease [Methylomonas]NJA07048.1 trypsin-like peptidase domain-containing protein [Methylococcaceae bacterium WWC4]OAI28209.1 peptidase S1 [Methylomonas koyamae]OHX38409.1 serine protease [Methylomonas sp. LWB]WGS87165.1 serine protease [Methylomonas sp. UP202]